MLKLVVGLGNPGDKYKGTRHNIGFMVLDRLAERLGLAWRSGHKGMYCQSSEYKLFLLKPETYMNLSGESVFSLCQYFKIAPDEVLIVHDELDYEYGKMKYRIGGSAGGHNGIRSVIDHLDTESFPRLRMGVAGISRAAMRGYTAEYVLANFTKDEQGAMDEYIDKAVDSILFYSKHDIQKTMQEFN